MSDSTPKPKIMVENISCILPQQSQLGALFLGNVYGAQNPTILKEYGVRAVLTSSIETDINYAFQDIPFHMKIEAHDKENYNLKEHINKCIDFIEKARQLTNVYVHCFAGVSRSAAIVCAYIMWKLKWNYETTIAFVKAKRIVAKPNEGFVRQLLEIEEAILGYSSYSPVDQATVESVISSPVKVNQTITTSVAAKQPLQHQNATVQVIENQSKQMKKQNLSHQRESSDLRNQSANVVQKNIENQNQNQANYAQSKFIKSPIQSGVQTPERFHNPPLVTSPAINQATYQNIQVPADQPQKTDRFAYLQNFFPQNHSTQQAPHQHHDRSMNQSINQNLQNFDKSVTQNYKVIENGQKPRSNISLNTTTQNWKSAQKEDNLYLTSTQGFKNIQNMQGSSSKNLMNTVTEKGLSSNNQLVLGGKKPTYSHNSTPVPKVLERNSQHKSNNYLQRMNDLPSQVNNRTMIEGQTNNRASQGGQTNQGGIQIMPKVNEYMWNENTQQQKFSIRNMLSEQSIKSPMNANIYNKKFDFRNMTATEGFYNSKSTSQQKQSQKSNSRLLVRPKDLPGYKNY